MTKNPDPQRPVVLVVDDAPSSLGMLCDTLESEGYTVLVARDGTAALDLLELVVPDAILLDAVMPGLSGFDTCKQIKANPALAHIPVIFMTGLSETPHVLEGFACGGVDYVVKPLRSQEVVVRLHTHTRNARIARLALWLQTLDNTAAAGSLPDEVYIAINTTTDPVLLNTDGAPLTVRNMGRVGMGETMLLLEQRTSNGADTARLAQAALTPRETEVLSWLAKGKTNRDIGDILGMSHRTVNKHLERIFEKLGVETRAAATALAVGHSATYS
jgi:DNA-binding NarL/FixJ family response regulator